MGVVDWLIIVAVAWLCGVVVVTAWVGKATAAVHDFDLWDLELADRDEGDVSCS